VIHITPSMDDIINYLELMLDRDFEPDSRSGDLRADIMNVTVKRYLICV